MHTLGTMKVHVTNHIQARDTSNHTQPDRLSNLPWKSFKWLDMSRKSTRLQLSKY